MPKELPTVAVSIAPEDEWVSMVTALRRKQGTPTKKERQFQQFNFPWAIARDAEAIGAEIAVARYFGVDNFTPSVDTFKASADVLGHIEVKHTRWDDGHLIIKPSDRDGDVAILVTGQSPNYVIRGWIAVHVAKSERYRQQKSESWWVGQVNLNPIKHLEKSIYANHPA